MPDEVASLYVAYQQAEQSGDLAATLEAADAVYRAARRARVDDVTLGALAENLGYYASASQDFERAYDAWREAAEYSEDAEEGALVGGYRWHQAAQAAFANSDIVDAARCSRRATQHLQSDPSIREQQTAFYGDAHFVNAAANFQLGQYARMVEPAQAAIDAFVETGREADIVYARAHYYRGLGALVEMNYEDTAVHMHIAGDIFQLADASEEEEEYVRGVGSVAYLLADNPNSPEVRDLHRGEEFDPRDFEDRVRERLEQSQFHLATMEPEASPLTTLPEGAERAMRVEFEPPRYPRRAARQWMEGVAIVEFDVDTQGQPTNVRTRFALPSGYFEEAAEEAVSRARYAPATLNGEAIEHPGLVVQFNFELVDRDEDTD